MLFEFPLSKGLHKDYWKVGDYDGMEIGYLDTFDSSPPVSGPPYGNGDQWAYNNGEDDWKQPIGEISVECVN